MEDHQMNPCILENKPASVRVSLSLSFSTGLPKLVTRDEYREEHRSLSDGINVPIHRAISLLFLHPAALLVTVTDVL